MLVPVPGQTIERYVVEAELGRGGMAVVYRVRHARLGSLHALKVLTLTSAGLQRRLLQEGQAQATLRHPHVVAVTDVLDVGGQPGLVMEFVDGPTLEGWLEHNRPSLAEADRLFRAILSAVEAAHQSGLIHRDLKPANVLLAPASGGLHPKVADFGLAKAVVEDSSAQHATRSGVAMGTPRYMAPEQVRDARRVDRRADIFSLGCILFELATGEPAFEGPDVLSVFNRVCSGDFRAPESLVPGLPEPVLAAIRGCLAVDPDQRIPDCATLRAVLDGQPFVVQPPTARPTLAPPASLRSDETWAGTLAGAAATIDMGENAPKRLSAPAPSLLRRYGPAVALGVLGLGAMGSLGLATGVFLGLRAWAISTVHAQVAEVSGGDGAVGAVVPGLTGIELRDLVVLGRDKRPVATAASVFVEGPGLFLGLGAVRRVRLEGVRVDLRQDGQGWITPAESSATRLQEQANTITFGPVDLEVQDVKLSARAPDGTLDASLASLAITGFRRDDKGFGAQSWVLERLEVRDERPVVSVAEIRGDGASARVEGLDLWIRTRRDGFLDWPPVVVDGVPTWLGGRAHELTWPEEIPLASLLSSTTTEVGRGTIQVVDNAHAARDVTWVLDLETARVFAEGEDARLTATANHGDAALALDVRRVASGDVAARLDVQGLALARVDPYLADKLGEHRLVTVGGLVDARFEVDERGEAIGWNAAVEVTEPRFESATGRAEDVPGRSRRLLTPRARVAFTADGMGVLRDPAFRPIQELLEEAHDALFGSPTSRLANLLKPPPARPTRRAPEEEPVASAPEPTEVPPSVPDDLEERWRRRQEATRRWLEEVSRQVPKK